jgi:hypothetical protein
MRTSDLGVGGAHDYYFPNLSGYFLLAVCGNLRAYVFNIGIVIGRVVGLWFEAPATAHSIAIPKF